MQRQYILGINVHKMPWQRRRSDDMHPFTSHEIWFHQFQDLFSRTFNEHLHPLKKWRLLLWKCCPISYHKRTLNGHTGNFPHYELHLNESSCLFMHELSSASLRSAAKHECECTQSCINMSLCLMVLHCTVVSI